MLWGFFGSVKVDMLMCMIYACPYSMLLLLFSLTSRSTVSCLSVGYSMMAFRVDEVRVMRFSIQYFLSVSALRDVLWDL